MTLSVVPPPRGIAGYATLAETSIFRDFREIDMIRKFAVLAIAMIVTGCATYGGYQPTVDPYNDRNIGRLEQDKAECGSLANQAGSLGSDTLKGAGMGALIGAAGGAAHLAGLDGVMHRREQRVPLSCIVVRLQDDEASARRLRVDLEL